MSGFAHYEILNGSLAMKKIILRAFAALCFCCSVGQIYAVDYQTEPTDRAALQVTKNLYTYLATRRASAQNKMIEGQHLGGINQLLVSPYSLNYDVHLIDGKGPGMVGSRYDSDKKIDEVMPYPYVLDPIYCSQINASLIAIWKAHQPIIHITATPPNPWVRNRGREPTQNLDSIAALLKGADYTPAKGQFWLDIDLIANALQELQAQGIPVLFRPFAEFNQSNKYYYNNQKPEDFVQLWKEVYDHYVNIKGLHNLLFCWEVWALNRSADEANLGKWYPDGFVDVVAGSFYFRADIAYLNAGVFSFPQAKNDQKVYDFLVSKDRPFGAAQWGLNQANSDKTVQGDHSFTLAFMNANPDLAFAYYWDSPQAVEEQLYKSEFVAEPRVATADDLPRFTPASIRADDLNSDKKSDLLVQSFTGTTSAWLMNGTSISSTANLLTNDPLWSVTHTADFNGDGKADILWRNANGAVTLWLMNGTAVTLATGLLGPDASWRVSHVGDFNGDGKADILWRNLNGAVTLWLMDGVNVISRAGLLGPDPLWSVSHIGDFNGDGKADILWRNTNGAVTMWLMNGASIASSAGILGPDPNWRVSHVADLDGDGKSDLLWRNNNGAVTAWLMNGTSVISTAGLLDPDPNWSVSHTGDFNGDGKADLLWRNSNGAVTQWIMNGTSVITATALLGPEPNWRVTHLSDYNGDGKADILWRNVDGSITMWLMNGTVVTERAGIAGPGALMVVPTMQ
jgi:Glycosyl hydrolase family 26/FG-GAP-like repeat